MPRARITGRAEVLASAAVSAVAMLAVSASAADEEQPGRFQLGPVYLTPRVVLRNAGVTSNVFNDENAPVSDRSAVLTPALDAVLPLGKRLRILGTGELGLNYFQHESSERSTDRRLSARAELDLGPLTFFAQGNAGRSKQRFSIEVDERLDRTESGVRFGVSLRATGRLRLRVAAGGGRSRYQDGVAVEGDEVQNSLDRDNLTGSATLSYALTRRTDLTASVQRVEDRFVETDTGPDTALSERYLGGFSFGAAFFTGRLLMGVTRFPAGESQAVPTFDGLAVSVDLAMPLTRSGRLTLLASRDVNYAVERADIDGQSRRNTYVLGSYGATLAYELPGSLLARPHVRFQRAAYELPVLVDGRELRRTDRQTSLGTSLLRAFGRSLRLGGTVERAWRRSTRDGRDFVTWRYGVTAEFTP